MLMNFVSEIHNEYRMKMEAMKNQFNEESQEKSYAIEMFRNVIDEIN